MRDATMPDPIRQVFPTIIRLALMAGTLTLLGFELRTVHFPALTFDILHTPPRRLKWAVLLTMLDYAILSVNDLVAFAYIGRRLTRGRIMLASFVANAIANNVGFAALSGASVRYRFYVRWGVTPGELSRIVLACGVAFWLGLLALGGVSLALNPPLSLPELAPQESVVAGWLLIMASVAYPTATFLRRQPIRIGLFELPLPSPRIALAQLTVSAMDWAVAAAAFYVLLPSSHLSFATLFGAFLVAQLLGLVSHVPGGVGVFDGTIVVLIGPYMSSAELLPALAVYRAVYYFLPLTVATAVLAADETRQRWAGHTSMGSPLPD